MIYSTNFEEISGKINFIDMCKYVSDLEWIKYTGRTQESVAIYQKTIRQQCFQINIPCDRSFEDYAFSMYNVVRTLSRTENKSEEQLILELLNPLSDIIRVRQISENVENGSIYFEDAINLFENSKKLLLAATLDTISYKKSYHGRAPEKIQEFLSKCRFGQTEIGSYVISLVCPFMNVEPTGELVQLSLFTDEENAAYSTTRKATKKMIDSITLIKKTIEEGADLTSLIDEQQNKISINFVEALANLNLAQDNNSIEIIAKWAPTIKENKSNADIVMITHDYYMPLKAVIDKYKSDESSTKVIIDGKIYHLTSNPNVEKRDFGEVKLLSLNDSSGKTKRTKVTLNSEYYSIAIIAHKEGKTVRVTGENINNTIVDATLEIL